MTDSSPGRVFCVQCCHARNAFTRPHGLAGLRACGAFFSGGTIGVYSMTKLAIHARFASCSSSNTSTYQQQYLYHGVNRVTGTSKDSRARVRSNGHRALEADEEAAEETNGEFVFISLPVPFNRRIK